MKKKDKINAAKFEKQHAKFKGTTPDLKPKEIQGFMMRNGFSKDWTNERIAELLTMSSAESTKLRQDPNTSNFQLIVIALVEAAIRQADSTRLDYFFDKLFGRTIKVESTLAVDNRTDLELSPIDAELMQRAVERAIRNKLVSEL